MAGSEEGLGWVVLAPEFLLPLGLDRLGQRCQLLGGSGSSGGRGSGALLWNRVFHQEGNK